MTSETARGLLCIWTDIDPAHEADFNRWYDREHMQERVAIPRFQNARRFAASQPCPRPYLALYYTDSLDVFRSEAYARAFANQTPWSLENFKRMRGTQRRVGKLSVETGAGEGGALALFNVPATLLAQPGMTARLAESLRTLMQEDGVVCAAMLETDPALSTPVTADAVPAPADALIMVEATRADAALRHAATLSTSLGLPEDAVYSFQALWRLASTDLFRKEI
ncbi:MAG: DUF4286 family protein [Hydrogenophaga sp.]|uniref:DUF4286 family protein n=1 Tax=Hydrogenophaga sp. TaxID=1904254 RepID=UPI002ABCDA3A|nr:DUF4286 family protein [Hydrogenophaga sp.]MDZ4101729.1 DUF4286 family protein [Hydrogenophaga sp.]